MSARVSSDSGSPLVACAAEEGRGLVCAQSGKTSVQTKTANVSLFSCIFWNSRRCSALPFHLPTVPCGQTGLSLQETRDTSFAMGCCPRSQAKTSRRRAKFQCLGGRGSLPKPDGHVIEIFQKLLFHFAARDDGVDESVIEEKFGRLKTGRQLGLRGVLDDARTGETNHCAGFGDDQIAHAGITGHDAGGGGVGENAEIRELCAGVIGKCAAGL